MKVGSRRDPAGFDVYTVEEGDSTFELSSFGGQLLSWRKGGVEVLFSNRERAILDGKTPYRGGAPICFPYFGKGGLMPGAPALAPQHGRARTTVWDVETLGDRLVFTTQQESPEEVGQTSFACELAYIFRDGVQIEAKVVNAGSMAAPFQLAIHSYWTADEPSAALVSGLGREFLDNLAGYAQALDSASDQPHPAPFDRVYLQPSPTMRLETGAVTVDITTEGCQGAVLWNPGPDHTIGDLDSPDFVCVESGVISPSVSLAPGEAYEFKVAYSARI